MFCRGTQEQGSPVVLVPSWPSFTSLIHFHLRASKIRHAQRNRFNSHFVKCSEIDGKYNNHVSDAQLDLSLSGSSGIVIVLFKFISFCSSIVPISICFASISYWMCIKCLLVVSSSDFVRIFFSLCSNLSFVMVSIFKTPVS